MGTDIKEYKNLTGLLLGPIRQRPAMYLGEAKISSLPNFILGYNMGFNMARNRDVSIDEYFSENGFLEWFFKKYNIAQTSFWHTPFLEEAKQDEKKALELFFKYLEEYNTENSK
jgi:DNA gyrase/topoisomerase IV subunit B